MYVNTVKYHFIIISLLLTIPSVAAYSPQIDLISKNSLLISGLGSLALLIITLISINLYKYKKPSFNNHKKILFLTMTAIIICISLLLISATLYKNYASVTKGPVHWHADFEIYICNEKIDLIAPKEL